jgi:hypothetical protein
MMIIIKSFLLKQNLSHQCNRVILQPITKLLWVDYQTGNDKLCLVFSWSPITPHKSSIPDQQAAWLRAGRNRSVAISIIITY